MPAFDPAVHAAETSDIVQRELPQDAPQSMTLRQAAQMLAAVSNRPKQQEQAAPVEVAPEAPQESEAPQTAAAEDSAPPQEAPAEPTESPAEPELPAIEPPRSWNASEKDRFRSLPRETQAYLAERETERDRALSRSQNEHAEKLRGLTAKEQAVEQARQQYEAALPQLLQTLQTDQSGQFSDIRTIQDVENLARNDWPRYLQWDVAQKKIAAVQQEMQAAQQRQQQEKLQKWSEFARREDGLFTEAVPDMADQTKAAKLQQAAVTLLKDVGFTDEELGESWNGNKDLSLRDHRLQLLIRDATLWRDAQQKAVAAVKKPVPPVQRPGVQVTRDAGKESEIQNLLKEIDAANVAGNSLRAARLGGKLIAARRAAR